MEFEELGAEVWAISPDPVARLADYASKHGIRFALLSDDDLAIIRDWGLVNESHPEVPHPTAVIVGPDGKVRYLRQDVDYRKRPSARELLDVLSREQ